MIGPSVTRVPQVRDELYATLDARLASWQVFDGPPDVTTYQDDTLVIGDNTNMVTVDVEVERAEGLGTRLQETMRISCSLMTVSGSTSMTARRARLLEGLEDITAVLQDGTRLGGLVDAVSLGPSMMWGEVQSDTGATAEVQFSIVARCLL